MNLLKVLIYPSFRIATWNLRRPRKGGWKYNQVIQNQIRAVNADIWILTETNDCISPGEEYSCVTSLSLPNYSSGENCSTIWSRYPIQQQAEIQESGVTACAEVSTPIGNLIVHGTVIAAATKLEPIFLLGAVRSAAPNKKITAI